MEKPANCIIVIFGASGDLTKRKLIPALYKLYIKKLLPEKFAILGTGRTQMTDDSFRESATEGIRSEDDKDEKMSGQFRQLLHYTSLNTNSPEEYVKIKDRLRDLDSSMEIGGNYIYYLATPPTMYETIAMSLGLHSLQVQSEGSWKRMIIEKPFGSDLESAKSLNRRLCKIFNEDQIYRIDHFLGKETVQNIFIMRFANGIFEPLWNRNYVHHVEITAAESQGIGSRGGYYDTSGALRDMVQNHLLQLVGLVAMEPPSTLEPDSIRNERVKVFQSLRPLKAEAVNSCVIRGQYTASNVRGDVLTGYREEANVDRESRTETYVAIKFYIDNWRWGGVPFYIRTGKRLPTSVTEIVIHFRPTPHRLFRLAENPYNQLVIRIQPDEGILVKLSMKIPGAGYNVREINLDFHYSELSDIHLPEAYERLLLDAMVGDSTLYARGDSVEACWEFIQPILDAWKEYPWIRLYGYPAGSWGPENADDLIEGSALAWRYPCKNLEGDGLYCEL
ncbi:MAG: glucose-6-phosphate dehydrogenase [Ignavibacteriales bacterium]